LPQSTADLMVPNLISWRQFGKTSYSVNWNVDGKCIALLQCVQYEVPKTYALHVYAVIVSFQDIRISKKDRQHSGHQKKHKRQTTIYKTYTSNERSSNENHTKNGDELRCSVMNEHYGMLIVVCLLCFFWWPLCCLSFFDIRI
jgi:hypothetical protein